jgi:hypothetical protein
LTGEILDKFTQLITTALGLVAALAWMMPSRPCFSRSLARREGPGRQALLRGPGHARSLRRSPAKEKNLVLDVVREVAPLPLEGLLRHLTSSPTEKEVHFAYYYSYS